MAEQPADPWALVRDWRDHGGSRSIPLSAECESSTVIPSTPYTQTRTHLYTDTHTRSQGLGRICAVWELLRSAFQGKRPAKPQKQPNTISSWSATYHCSLQRYMNLSFPRRDIMESTDILSGKQVQTSLGRAVNSTIRVYTLVEGNKDTILRYVPDNLRT